MFDVMRVLLLSYSISHSSPSLRNTYGRSRNGSLCLQLFVLGFACKRDVYHSLANIEWNDFCFYSGLRTNNNNNKKSSTRLVFLILASISCVSSYKMLQATWCYVTLHAFLHVWKQWKWSKERGKNHTKNSPKCEMNGCIIHFCVDGVCVCVLFYIVFIVYLVHVSSENCF